MPRAAEAALVAVRDGLVERERRQAGRVDALGEVEVALAALAPGDGDLAAQGESLEHLGDVAVVGPAGRGPGHDARVGDVAREQRTLGVEPGEDVATERVVGGQPVGHERVGLRVAHLGDDGGHVLGAAHEGDGLDEGVVVLEGAGQVGRVVGRCRAGSTARGRRWARWPPSGRSAAGSAARRPRRGRSGAAGRAAARGSRCDAPGRR